MHCLKYGLTVHNIASCAWLRMTGDIVEVGSDSLDGAAPGG